MTSDAPCHTETTADSAVTLQSFSLTGHHALVTGSSQGIGLAIALGIRNAGAAVVFHGKDSSAPLLPPHCVYLPQDLLDNNGAEELVSAAFKTAPTLDLLVCNAGGFFDIPFLEMTPERWEKTINLNVRSTYFVAQYFARQLLAQKRHGAIVIVCSTNGFQSEEDTSAYDTSKGALVMLTRTLAHAMAPFGIRVNGLAPGLILTSLNIPLLDRQKIRHYEKKILQGRVGSPDDCAGTAIFLLSEASRYITGQVLVVDGGLTVSQLGRS